MPWQIHWMDFTITSIKKKLQWENLPAWDAQMQNQEMKIVSESFCDTNTADEIKVSRNLKIVHLRGGRGRRRRRRRRRRTSPATKYQLPDKS